MNIFWMDRDGSEPPENGSFGYCPFSQNSPLLCESVTRIRNLPPPTKPIRVMRRTFLPTREEWSLNMEKTREQKTFDKVVLARCCVFECETAPDPFAVTARLLTQAQNSTVFCYANEQMAFLGATPELLFSKVGRELQSEAVAGTCKRGKTTKEDKTLEEALLVNQKAVSEIAPVAAFLQDRLSLLCSPLVFSPLHVRKTPNVQHLCMQVEGRLHQETPDAKILQQIHPTPALCGSPTKNARDWIAKIEPFERGLYGGALGWSTPEKSVWVVAIRCCLIQNTTVKLYTGAGIVAKSNPQEEWEELDHKMELYKDIFV